MAMSRCFGFEFEDDVGDVEIKNILMQNEKKYSR